MTEEFGGGDPVIRRLQQAFAHEEPATELAAVLQRAARYQTGGAPADPDAPAPGHDLTQADLVAARRREPAALARIYTAYAPALTRFFMAAVGDRDQADDLTGSAFVRAIEALPRFRGKVDALGGWLFQIARHDLYDHRRRQARAGVEPLDADWATDAPPNPLSPREREVLGLAVNGWSNAQIGRALDISLHTVRTHLENITVKLGVHSKLEAVAVALDHGWLPYPSDPDDLVIDRLGSGRVVAAMRQLSPDQREVLLLRMAGGLTAPEVAELLGKTTGAVKALQHRGLASLARALGLENEVPAAEQASSGPEHLTRDERQEG